MSKPFAGDWHAHAAESPIYFGLLLGVLIAALLSVAFSLLVSVLRLMPESPLSHVQLTWEAIVIRGLLGRRRFAWSELGRFAIVTSPSDYEANYLVAARPDDESDIGNDQDRYRRAVFRLRSDPYCGAADAELLARWLNEIRSAVAGRKPSDIAFFAPSPLSGNLRAGTGTALNQGRRKMQHGSFHVTER